MLKLAIAASISIGSLLSIATIADARSILQGSGYAKTTDQAKPYLIAKQSTATPKSPSQNIAESDLQGIHKAIASRYSDKNQILENALSKSRRFYEIKVLKLISFSGTKAQIEIQENIRNYTLIGTRHQDFQNRTFQKAPGTEYSKHTFNIDLQKSGGKWKVNSKSK